MSVRKAYPGRISNKQAGDGCIFNPDFIRSHMLKGAKGTCQLLIPLVIFQVIFHPISLIRVIMTIPPIMLV
jgi:hypothetical protein